MTDIRINTEAAVTAADHIDQINKQINDSFDPVMRAVKGLGKSWDGPAAAKAIPRFDTIREANCTNRYKVLENYTTLLRNAVGLGYEKTETTNISLADQFK